MDTTLTKHVVVAALQGHTGKANGIGARELAANVGCSERELRKLISELIIEDGYAIAGTPSSGYFIPANHDECLETVEFHKRRALHELLKASRLSGKPVLELAGQLLLKT